MKLYPNYFFLLFTLFFFSCSQPVQNIPIVKNGILDLSSWDFERDGSVSLDGDWEFYWGQLLTPVDFKSDSLPKLSGYCTVPGTWEQHPIGSNLFPGRGYATYRLRIKTGDLPRYLSMKLLDMSSSYNLFVNDEHIAKNGITSTHPDSMRAQYLPLVAEFGNSKNDIQLVVQISNNIHRKGGIWTPILLGTPNDIMRTHHLSYMYNLFLAGLLFILFIYHLWIYLLRRSELVALGFGLLCLVVFLRTVTTNERLLMVLFPNLDVSLGLRLEYLALALAGLSGSLFYYFLFPKDYPRRILYIFLVLSAGEILSLLVLPPHVFTKLSMMLQISIILKAIVMISASVAGAIRKRESALPFLISSIIITVCIINDILNANMVISTFYVIPYGFLFYILSQAYFLASRISKSFHTLEVLSANLEQKVQQRTELLQLEKKKSDDLLHNILPEEVAEELKNNGNSEARFHPDVTVLFTDFAGFTSISEKLTPTELVKEIDTCFKAFDSIIEHYGLEKIKTIGDSYLAVCGLPLADPQHAEKATRAALEIRNWIGNHKQGGGRFDIRIGLNSGPVVAGIVGSKKFAYDIWGDTVNTASRLESNGIIGNVNISNTTYELIRTIPELTFQSRGKIDTKGKGEVEMWFVN